MSRSVFLGGSCNPTTWRTDTAIPLLDSADISYFNPHVDEWKPELIEIEHEAKEEAEVLFFTIDNETRSVVSAIECAYLAGCGRNLVLVMEKFKGRQEIMNERITSREFKDIACGKNHLKFFADRESIPLFSNIQEGLDCTVKLMKEKKTVQMINPKKNILWEDIPQDEKFFKVVYQSLKDKSENVTINEAFSVVKLMAGEKSFNKDRFQKGVVQTLGSRFASIPFSTYQDFSLNLEQFTSIIRNYFAQSVIAEAASCSLVGQCMDSIRKGIYEKFCNSMGPLILGANPETEEGNDQYNSQQPQVVLSFPPRNQVHLGGSCDKTNWREKLAVPTLQKRGISFFDPLNSCWTEKLIPSELQMMEGCDLSLFVITGETRSLAAMTMAAYFIGKKRKVILYVQDIAQKCLVAGEILSNRAVRDYNRGRAYLRDMAVRNGIKVHSTLEAAIEEVVDTFR